MDVLSALKNVAGLAKKISDIPLQQSIIDLQNSYLEAQEKHRESKEQLEAEVAKLKTENEKLKKAFAIKTTVKKLWSRLWTVDGGTIDGPFCITCWERNQQLLTMIKNDGHDVLCPTCKIKMMSTRVPTEKDFASGAIS
jgi:DNA-directed RNA polymerase subunit RPC12/RpoP